ncbi:hypothetical protein EYB53_009440 [Candidatus Chloroploca sp. M-50]|uniref:Tetratricopeptide repeat protein n=1 Tax=Candidatus Chloroploca mongolica TaxID=2528176 RepID=A0ABS4D924_9CHLR|nr:hypothetical protein [Candidatus Chloroploca mongolica]MBP1465926.1 hypothetical protein [Candidatus Chloroploca mongolica]
MTANTSVSRWAARIAEASWLLALSFIPLYFNLYSARHFEPDKIAVVRSLALVGAAAVLIGLLDTWLSREKRKPAVTDPPPEEATPVPPLWRRFAAIPLAVPTAVYAGVFLLTTITSVTPWMSFWGSYQRLQGTYTNLSYIMLFIVILVTLRHREQLERMVTIMIATGIAVAGYGLLQHFGLDPLPWRGDVLTRIASTMGNSIFVAAYMIMIVPFALYRMLVAFSDAPTAPQAGPLLGREWLWTLVRALLVLAGLMLLLATIKFGAVIRVIDARYWWVWPGSIVATTTIWWLLTINFDRGDRRMPLWPGLFTMGFLLLFALQFAISAGSGAQTLLTSDQAAHASDWSIWFFASLAALIGAYALGMTLPRRPLEPTRAGRLLDGAAAGLATLMLLVAIVFSQSRGPWIGLGAGLFVFFSLVLWQALRHARATDQMTRARLFRGLLIGWVTLTLAVGGFLITFNLSKAPVFEQLRDVPYIGRMGRLLEVGEGTGLVRRLIWIGDEHAGGAIALIMSDPVRAVIGWGPESMFVAFNPFYPPSLANIEARGASPDRSHQALLDELVTRGLLGLVSYLFLLVSFVFLSWKLMRNSTSWRWQVFFIACLSTITATFVEGLTGIPIVSTLTHFWMVLAMTVTGGALAGHYRLSLAPLEPAVAAVPEDGASAEQAHRSGQASGKRRKGPVRGQQVARGGNSARSRNTVPGAGPIFAYSMVAVLTLIAIFSFNFNPIRADMHFQQAQGLSERAETSADGLIMALNEYLQTIRLNAREDFYYLNLGRVLMSLADTVRAQSPELGTPKDDPQLTVLLGLDSSSAIASFVQQSTPNELMSYAEAVLLHAHNRSPLNKDHFANLGRLNSVWYRWSNDPVHLENALDWYDQVEELAPQDVTLLNEFAGVLILKGDQLMAEGQTEEAQAAFARAEELLQRSAALDQRYVDTYIRLADLTLSRNQDLIAATNAYSQAIGISARQTVNSIENVANALAEQPELILQLRDAYLRVIATQEERYQKLDPQSSAAQSLRSDLALLHTVAGLLSVRGGDTEAALVAYARAAELEPNNLNYIRNYAIVLSEVSRHADAVAELRALIGRLEVGTGNEATIAEAQQLIAYFEQLQGAP